MKQPKHTPGPWSVDAEWKNGIWILEQNSDVGVCKVHTDHDTKEESDANAQLIAAAPEMLKLHQQILRLLKGRESLGPIEVKVLEEEINKIIAKATGGAE